MSVVADTMILRYLIEIEVVSILPRLFDEVIIPPAVARELQHTKTPAVVRTWMTITPSWLHMRQPTMPRDPSLRRLHPGEQDAFLLMMEHVAPLLLTDDGDAVARHERTREAVAGMPVFGSVVQRTRDQPASTGACAKMPHDGLRKTWHTVTPAMRWPASAPEQGFHR